MLKTHQKSIAIDYRSDSWLRSKFFKYDDLEIRIFAGRTIDGEKVFILEEKTHKTSKMVSLMLSMKASIPVMFEFGWAVLILGDDSKCYGGLDLLGAEIAQELSLQIDGLDNISLIDSTPFISTGWLSRYTAS